MNSEFSKIESLASATVGRSASHHEGGVVEGFYYIECYDVDGNLKWTDTIENVVMNGGKADILDHYWGLTNNSAFYMGLISSVGYSSTPVAADTMASHATWNEAQGATNVPDYTSSTRVTTSWASSGATVANPSVKSTSSTTNFTMAAGSSGNGTVKGCFITTNNTKGGTTGVLISAGLFTQGDKIVQSNDQLNVSYTFNLA